MVTEQDLEVLADRFNLSRADVHGVITFYRDFTTSPAGSARVRVCRGEACQAVGANGLLESLRATLGDVGEVFCLGNCALGPSVSIDGRVLGRATADRVCRSSGEDRVGTGTRRRLAPTVATLPVVTFALRVLWLGLAGVTLR